jgi:hypothetical protein
MNVRNYNSKAAAYKPKHQGRLRAVQDPAIFREVIRYLKSLRKSADSLTVGGEAEWELTEGEIAAYKDGIEDCITKLQHGR